MKKASLKKLELKIDKVNDLKAKKVKGGIRTRLCNYTDANPGPFTSAVACYC